MWQAQENKILFARILNNIRIAFFQTYSKLLIEARYDDERHRTYYIGRPTCDYISNTHITQPSRPLLWNVCQYDVINMATTRGTGRPETRDRISAYDCVVRRTSGRDWVQSTQRWASDAAIHAVSCVWRRDAVEY